MNAKLCKRLRRWAEDQTVGMPVRGYEMSRNGRQVVLTKNCTRYVYKQAKKRAATMSAK